LLLGLGINQKALTFICTLTGFLIKADRVSNDFVPSLFFLFVSDKN